MRTTTMPKRSPDTHNVTEPSNNIFIFTEKLKLTTSMTNKVALFGILIKMFDPLVVEKWITLG